MQSPLIFIKIGLTVSFFLIGIPLRIIQNPDDGIQIFKLCPLVFLKFILNVIAFSPVFINIACK